LFREKHNTYKKNAYKETIQGCASRLHREFLTEIMIIKSKIITKDDYFLEYIGKNTKHIWNRQI